MPKQQSALIDRLDSLIYEPRKYTVYFHNDDFTTMEFVMHVLQTIFFKSEDEAFVLMMAVHHGGKAPVGTYSYDIAISKAGKATRLARDNGFPLNITVEPEDFPEGSPL